MELIYEVNSRAWRKKHHEISPYSLPAGLTHIFSQFEPQFETHSLRAENDVTNL